MKKRHRQLTSSYRQLSAYYQLEQIYSEELVSKNGEAQKTLKGRMRSAVADRGFDRPEWTTHECNQRLQELNSD